MADTQYISGPEGRKLAYRHTATRSGHSFLWCSGFNSDMAGTKVLALEAWAIKAGHGVTAFDYSGHGESDGDFANGTITAWHEDTLAIIDQVTEGEICCIGSSMGGWMALLAAQARPDKIGSMVLIAPAPDFTEKLMWPNLPADAKFAIAQTGVWMQPSAYGDPVPITRGLIESGRAHTLMDAPIGFSGPVRILQGMQDADVPWTHAQSLVDVMASADLTFTLIKDGDHRLSREVDIARLIATCDELVRV